MAVVVSMVSTPRLGFLAATRTQNGEALAVLATGQLTFYVVRVREGHSSDIN